MSMLLKALEKAGLVKLDDESSNVVSAESIPSGSDLSDSELDPPAAGSGSEAQSFDSIYAEKNLPASPFPAEKLLKLLDGLRAMEPSTRRAAVMAMDAADEAWSIDDALHDAQRKVAALKQANSLVDRRVQQADALSVKTTGEIEKRQREAAAAIRKQIADLEALLQREVEKAATDKAAALTAARDARAAGERTRARLELEIDRLNEITRIFAVDSSSVPSPK